MPLLILTEVTSVKESDQGKLMSSPKFCGLFFQWGHADTMRLHQSQDGTTYGPYYKHVTIVNYASSSKNYSFNDTTSLYYTHVSVVI
jgi:hypothetical protein